MQKIGCNLQKSARLISEFSKVAGHKSSMKNLVIIYIQQQKKSEAENLKKIPFVITLKK